jgi:hypothetical protein
MAEVVGAPGQRRRCLRRCECRLTRCPPHPRVGRLLQRSTAATAEQSSIRSLPVRCEVLSEDANEHRWDGDAPHLIGRAVFEPTRVPGTSVIRPVLASSWFGAGQVQPSPPGLGQDTVVGAQRDRFRRPKTCVIEHGEECVQVFALSTLRADRGQELLDLIRAGYHPPGQRSRRPPVPTIGPGRSG